jgi:flagellar biogenesis protein FliO
METIDQLAAVLAVLGGLAAVTWWLRRRGFVRPGLLGKSTGRCLESLERLSLGPQQTLHLVRMGSRALLVAASPSGCAVLENVEMRHLVQAGEGAE